MTHTHIAFVGEVDHGKSTLLGRLLLETGSLSRQREEAVRAGSCSLAHVLDQLSREQEEGLTVSSAEVRLRLKEAEAGSPAELVLIDVPGHETLLRHMISGTSVAHAAVLVVEAPQGVTEETRRHALLVRLLQIDHVACVVNKLDCVPSQQQQRFSKIAEQVRTLGRALGLRFQHTVPASAREGTNVVKGTFPWYDGPTVLEVLCKFPAPDPAEGPLRFSVQDRYTFLPEPVVVGRVEQGILTAGTTLRALPGSVEVRIERIVTFPPRPVGEVRAGHVAAVVLTPPDRPPVGRVLVDPSHCPAVRTEVAGRVFSLGPEELRRGKQYLFRCASQETTAEVLRFCDRVSSGTLQRKGGGERLDLFDVATVVLRTERPVVVEDPRGSPSLGRFVLESRSGVIACGMVVLPGGAGAEPGT